MRIFCKQNNVIETSPALNKLDNDAVLSTLTITFTLYDKVTDVAVTDGSVVLEHIAGGVYRAVLPTVDDLINGTKYNAELVVLSGSTELYYFKGDIKAIIRSRIDV